MLTDSQADTIIDAIYEGPFQIAREMDDEEEKARLNALANRVRERTLTAEDVEEIKVLLEGERGAKRIIAALQKS